jgi:hypothetical protein
MGSGVRQSGARRPSSAAPEVRHPEELRQLYIRNIRQMFERIGAQVPEGPGQHGFQQESAAVHVAETRRQACVLPVSFP